MLLTEKPIVDAMVTLWRAIREQPQLGADVESALLKNRLDLQLSPRTGNIPLNDDAEQTPGWTKGLHSIQ